MVNRNFTVWDQIADQAEKNADSDALVSVEQSFTYGDLLNIVPRLSTWLSNRGVEMGSKVAIDLPPLPHSLVTLALSQIGATSATWISDEVFLRDGLDVLVTGKTVSNKEIIQAHVGEDWAAEISQCTPFSSQNHGASPEDLVRIVYSSGTTGLPKGVPFSRATLILRVQAARSNWILEQPFMSLLDVTTVSGMQTLFAQLLSGESYIIPGVGSQNVKLLKDRRVRSLKASPAQLRVLLEAGKSAGEQLPDLKFVQGAGSFIPANLAKDLNEHFRAEIVNLYGSTETGTVTIRRGVNDSEQLMGSIVQEAEVEIVSSDGRPLPIGEEGLVRVRTANMSSGYLGQEIPKESVGFISGWFYPGDRGYQDDQGLLYVTGRSNDLVNFGGLKYNLSYLESKILAEPLLVDAAVTEITAADQVAKLGVGFVGQARDELTVRSVLRELVAKEVGIEIHRLDLIPRTRTGKVDRAALRSQLEAMAVEQ